MDWTAGRGYGLELIKKYKFVLLVLLAGIFLMFLPDAEETSPQPEPAAENVSPGLQESLSVLLSKVSGAGKVEVLLTQAAGEETIYQTDEDISVDDVRREAVIITNSGKEETGLIRQINPPAYLGAIVLCQGADDANVRLAIVNAVMSVTGLTSDQITVLKMK